MVWTRIYRWAIIVGWTMKQWMGSGEGIKYPRYSRYLLEIGKQCRLAVVASCICPYVRESSRQMVIGTNSRGRCCVSVGLRRKRLPITLIYRYSCAEISREGFIRCSCLTSSRKKGKETTSSRNTRFFG